MSMNISIMRGTKGPFILKKLENGLFQIHSKNGGAYEGTRNMILDQSVRMGLWAPHFELAEKEMEKNGHDAAHFGIGGSFMWSYDSKKEAA